MATVYDTCAAEGCDRPYAWTELHHQRPWSRGGTTDLHDAVPACWFHHRRLHDPAFDHTLTTAANGKKTITFARRT
ncbi:MAG: HNH endonuclease [Kineosporiaceae bacterium]|nr:HNH endonuclease [Kineosporiaceae bacterium]